MKPNTLTPRQLKKQMAWYYPPRPGNESCRPETAVYIYHEIDGRVFEIRLPARKLLKELQAILT